jgi:hypothetical protein
MADNPKTLQGQKKPPLHLIPPSALIHMSAAMAHGADKYGPYNWRTEETEIPVSVYVAAAKRHIDDFWDGEFIVSDSTYGASHLGAAMAGLAVLVDAIEFGTVVDDRPRRGTTPELMEGWSRAGRLYSRGL